MILFTSYTMSQGGMTASHFMFNEACFNPSVAGHNPQLEVAMLSRTQWVGFDEAPRSGFLTLHAYQRRIGGLGLVVLNDRTGFESTLNINFQYAHHLRLSTYSTLSLGAGLGLLRKAVDGTKLIYEDEGDVNAIMHLKKKMKPDFSFGIEFNTPEFTFGVSATHLGQSFNESTLFDIPVHYYSYAKYRGELSYRFNLVQSAMYRASDNLQQFYLSTILFYDNSLWLGVAYRSQDAIVGLVGFHVSENIKFGYSYDVTMGRIQKFNDGSHEVMLRYGFDLNQKPLLRTTSRVF